MTLPKKQDPRETLDLSPHIHAIRGVRGGRPITKAGAISTAAIYACWLGGDRPFDIAWDYQITSLEVEAAINFEAGRAWADGGRKKWRAKR